MILFGKECPSCGAKNDKNAAFCDSCGQDMNNFRAARVEGNTWQARDDEFAASLSITDLEGTFIKQLVVKPGFRALIFQDGRLQGNVPAGEYTLDGFLAKLNRLGRNRAVRVILTRDTEVPVEFRVTDIPTKEFLPLEIELTLGLSIAAPELFAARLMGDGQAYRVADLHRLLLPRVRQVLADLVSGQGIRELSTASGLRARLDAGLGQGLARLLADNGLALGEVHTAAVGHTQYDANNQERAKAWLEVDRERGRLEQRKGLDEIYSEEEWRKIARLEAEQQIRSKTRDLETRDRGAEFEQRLRSIELLEKIAKANVREAALAHETREELAKLEQEAKRRGLDRGDEQTRWEHLRKLAEIKRETELAQGRIDQERSVTLARWELDREGERRRLEAEIADAALVDSEESRRLKKALERKAIEMDFNRDQELREVRHRTEVDSVELQRKESQREFERIQDYQDRVRQKEYREWEITQRAKEEEIKIEKLKGLSEIDASIDRRQQQAELAKREEDRKDKDQAARIERERVQTMGQLGPEALASMAPSDDRARVIADMQRSTGMQGLSEDQILAMAAERNPAVAEALKERYRHTASPDFGERERLYDRMLAQRDSEQDRLERVQRDAQMSQQALMNKVLETVASLQNRSASAPQTVFVTPSGLVQPQPQPEFAHAGTGRDTGRILVCPSCRSDNPLSARFCGNCGKPLA